MRRWCGKGVPSACTEGVQNAVKDWAGEEDIKAQLRELTKRTRELRHDLDALVRPPAASPARAFIHRQAWPKAAPDQAAEQPRRRKK